jgi:DeoR family transcriptional regulator, aga operon transcriptional repressor
VLDQERRRAILEVLNLEGRVLTAELSQRLRTSQVTIRKDLDLLHRERRLHRAHGGALPLGDFSDRPAVAEPEPSTDGNLQQIANAAVGQVSEKQVVVLDSGAISTAIARGLHSFRNLTVVTNAINIVAELSGTTIQVILAGGKLCNESSSFVGPLTEEMLQDLNADLFFLEAAGIDTSFGVSAETLAKAQVNRAMIRISQRIVAVCDAVVLGRRSCGMIAPAHALQQVITNRGISDGTARQFAEAGIEVTLV